MDRLKNVSVFSFHTEVRTDHILQRAKNLHAQTNIVASRAEANEAETKKVKEVLVTYGIRIQDLIGKSSTMLIMRTLTLNPRRHTHA